MRHHWRPFQAVPARYSVVHRKHLSISFLISIFSSLPHLFLVYIFHRSTVLASSSGDIFIGLLQRPQHTFGGGKLYRILGTHGAAGEQLYALGWKHGLDDTEPYACCFWRG